MGHLAHFPTEASAASIVSGAARDPTGRAAGPEGRLADAGQCSLRRWNARRSASIIMALQSRSISVPRLMW